MKKTFWLLLLILIIATGFRLYHITVTPPGLYPDEAMNGGNAHDAVASGDFKVFYPDNNGREGLFMNIQATILRVIGLNEPWVLRLASALFGIFTVWGMYFLGRELFSKHVGLLASFFMAVSFWHINFSRIGFRAIMAPAFAVWGIFFLIHALKKSHRGEHAILYGTIAGLFFGLGFHSYIAYRVMPLLALFIIGFCLYRAHREQRLKSCALAASVFAFTAFLVVIPLLFYFEANPGSFFGRTSQVSVFSSPTPARDLALNIAKTMWMFIGRGDGNWRHNFAGAPQLFLPVALLFFWGLALGAWTIFKRRHAPKITPISPQGGYLCSWFSIPKFSEWVLFLWFALAAAPVVISNEGIPHALRAILMIPPALLFAAVAGVQIYRWLEERADPTILKMAAVVFCIILVGQAYYAYFVAWARNPNVQGAFNADYVRIGRELNALPDNLPKYVIVRAGGTPVDTFDFDGNPVQIPVPAQTVMFITDTFRTAGQRAKNIHYILPGRENEIPPGAYTAVIE